MMSLDLMDLVELLLRFVLAVFDLRLWEDGSYGYPDTFNGCLEFLGWGCT
jgi:hypothetical protein